MFDASTRIVACNDAYLIMYNLSPTIARSGCTLLELIGHRKETGLLIERVTPGGAAERAGLRGGNRAVVLGLRRLLLGGDVLVSIDGRPIASDLELTRIEAVQNLAGVDVLVF